MTVRLSSSRAAAVPLHVVDTTTLATELRSALPRVQQWLRSCAFDGAADSFALVPAEDGRLQEVWVGVASADDPWALASLPQRLPEGEYRLGEGGLAVDPQVAAMSWTLGGYRFDRYQAPRRPSAILRLGPGDGARRGLMLAEAIAATRDLVNTPAEHMGPGELEQAARSLARTHKARCRVIVGDKLLKAGLPAIHTVGRAAAPDRAPRLIELNWGKAGAPQLCIVGKGVCFDTGGLDLKPSSSMRLMKKDMGGAAHALGLARLVMACALPVQLRVLIPAVENAVSGSSYRPGDVVSTRKGLPVEVGNTDAEGRVVLSDALTLAGEGRPDLIIDMATLTGAARVALGAELPALFCADMALARELVDRSLRLGDPVWHLPLWAPYRASIDGDIALIANSGKDGMAGAITAALFLQAFVPAGVDWLHLDLFAWNNRSRPGRPVGGEGQALRTLLDYLQARYAR